MNWEIPVRNYFIGERGVYASSCGHTAVLGSELDGG